MKLGWLCHCGTKKIKSGRKTANINTKNLRSFISVKAHFNDISKTAKTTCFILVLHWAIDVILWLLLHPWPNGVLE